MSSTSTEIIGRPGDLYICKANFTACAYRSLWSQFELHLEAKQSRFDHCNLVERDDLPAADRRHYSLVFGVNRRALLDILQFLVSHLVPLSQKICMTF